MTFTVSRTIPGKYAGQDHNGDQYFTDDVEVICEYEYNTQDFIDFLFEYSTDEHIKETILPLLERRYTVEEAVEEYADEFAKWLDKERE